MNLENEIRKVNLEIQGLTDQRKNFDIRISELRKKLTNCFTKEEVERVEFDILQAEKEATRIGLLLNNFLTKKSKLEEMVKEKNRQRIASDFSEADRKLCSILMKKIEFLKKILEIDEEFLGFSRTSYAKLKEDYVQKFGKNPQGALEGIDFHLISLLNCYIYINRT